MREKTLRPKMLLICAAVAGLSLACSDGPTASRSVAETQLKLAVVSGQEQVAKVGTRLPNPVVVSLSDAEGRPIDGQIVNFVVTAGGGSVFAGTATTNADGIAQEWWTLGAAVGTNSLEARAVDAETGERLVFATFTAQGVAEDPVVQSVSISPASANLSAAGQTVTFTAAATDQFGNAITPAASWTTLNASVATVTQAGVVTAVANGTTGVVATANGHADTAQVNVSIATTPPPGSGGEGEVIFSEGFESGSLAAWDDGVDAAKHRILSDASLARSGSRLLEISYPQGGDGGWLTKFFMPGYDSLRVSYWVRFPSNWQGPTKLLGIRGSRTDNQWSSFGNASQCPNGTNFFSSSIVTEGGSPGNTRFYNYYVGMAREPDGVTCWGRYSASSGTTYYPPLEMSLGAWHRVETWIRLNTPGQSNGAQRLWIDGVLRGEWNGLNFRTTRDLMLNAAQINANAQAPQAQRLYVDDFVVTANAGSGQSGTTPPPPTESPRVETVTVSPSTVSLTAVGATAQLQASARDQFGAPIATSFSWSSLNTSVATVGSGGLIAAVANGTTGVVVSAGGHADTAQVSVAVATTPPPPPPAGADEPIYQGGDASYFFDDFEAFTSTTHLLTWQSVVPGRWTKISNQGIDLITSGGHSGSKSARFTYSAGATQQDRLIEAQNGSGDPRVAMLTFWIRTMPGYQWINSSGNTHKIFNMNIGGGGSSTRILLSFGSEPLTPAMPAYGRLEQTRPSISIGVNNYNQNLNYPAVNINSSATDGNWHRITLRITKSTSRPSVDRGNGRLEMWFDGTKVIEYLGDDSSRPEYGLVNVPTTRLIPDLHFPSVMNAAPPTTQWIEYDDVRIWAR